MNAANAHAATDAPAPAEASSTQGDDRARAEASASDGGDPVPEGLTRRDMDILHFERQWWLYAGNKEQAIRDMFDLSPTRYYQVLNQVIDNPAALATDPLLVRRLRRLRSSRQKDRAARRLGMRR